MLTPFPRKPLGEGVHRSGWPWVLDQLAPLLDGEGPLFDDFVDATYTYRRVKGWVPDAPWVGVFHHPVSIDSPIGMDDGFYLRRLDKIPEFRRAKPLCVGAVGLSSEVAAELRDWLGVPVLHAKHPTQTAGVTQWSPGERRLFQVGFFLRNTRAIFQVPTVRGWEYHRSRPRGRTRWMAQRDAKLYAHYRGKRRQHRSLVEEHGRESNAEYDRLLSASVVLTEIYAAAANNVVIECMARATPLLVNRLPAVVEYLGPEYPLYFDDLEHAARLLSDYNRVVAAHEYLRAMDKRFLEGAAFVSSMRRFMGEVNGRLAIGNVG